MDAFASRLILICLLPALCCLPVCAQSYVGFYAQYYDIPREKVHAFANVVAHEVARICLLRKASPNTYVQIAVDGAGRVNSLTLSATRLNAVDRKALLNELKAHLFRNVPATQKDRLHLQITFYVRDDNKTSVTPGACSSFYRAYSAESKEYDTRIQLILDQKIESACEIEELLKARGYYNRKLSYCGSRSNTPIKPFISWDKRKKNADELLRGGNIQAAAMEYLVASMEPMLSGDLEASKVLIESAFSSASKLQKSDFLCYVDAVLDYSEKISCDSSLGARVLAERAQRALRTSGIQSETHQVKILNTLAKIAHRGGHNLKMEALSRESLKIQGSPKCAMEFSSLAVAYKNLADAQLGQGKLAEAMQEFTNKQDILGRALGKKELAQLSGVCEVIDYALEKKRTDCSLKMAQRVYDVVSAFELQECEEELPGGVNNSYDALKALSESEFEDQDHYPAGIKEEIPKENLPTLELVLRCVYELAVKLNQKDDIDECCADLLRFLVQYGKVQESEILYRQTIRYYYSLPNFDSSPATSLTEHYSEFLNQSGNKVKALALDALEKEIGNQARKNRSVSQTTKALPARRSAQVKFVDGLLRRERNGKQSVKPFDVETEIGKTKSSAVFTKSQNVSIEKIKGVVSSVKLGKLREAQAKEDDAINYVLAQKFTCTAKASILNSLQELAYAYMNCSALDRAEIVLKKCVEISNQSSISGPSELRFLMQVGESLEEKYQLVGKTARGFGLLTYMIDEREKKFGVDQDSLEGRFRLAQLILEAGFKEHSKVAANEFRVRSSTMFDAAMVLADRDTGHGSRIVETAIYSRCLELRTHEESEEADRIEGRK